MTAIRKPAQAGFTLIELIVVIVILGILAATALPRFANMGGSARVAALNAARGALSTTAATVHGQSLLNPSLTSVVNENVTVNIVNGYPAADANTAAAAGLALPDWDIIVGSVGADTTNHTPAVAASSFVAIPHSVHGAVTATTCLVTYTASTGANIPPVITMNSTDTNCQ